MKIAFVMDQQVGLRTHALTLKKHVQANPAIEATFIDVRYDARPLHKLPGSGTLAGVREIRRGIGNPTRFDAIVWASWATKFVPDLVEAVPSYLIMDMTPTQMALMGDFYGYTARRAEFLGAYKRRSTERIYRAARHFFPWNAWVGQSLIRDWGVPEDKITPLSPGVDTSLFQPVRAPEMPLSLGDRGAIRAGNGAKVRLLFVGGDFLRKGGDSLVRWARETTLPVEVHLVTRDTVNDIPENIVIRRGMAPLSPELVALYQSSDIFVLPTRADCYSLVALEAMACGLPVVISPLGGIPEIVTDSGTGYLVPSDDYDTLTARLNTLVTDPVLRARMGAAARARACRHFDAAQLVERLMTTIAGQGTLQELPRITKAKAA
ncbi:MAG: glycosyltransferase family 4 protein [Armatimonas sp.]